MFITFVVFEAPGLGIAHLFYLPVAALALTGGVKRLRGSHRTPEAATPFALLLGDMDGLQAINDSQGHAEGNDALRRRLGLMLGTSSGASGRGAASYSVGRCQT